MSDDPYKRGYYADPMSPIASTPQRRRPAASSAAPSPVTPSRRDASDPSAVPLSPLRGPAERPLARKEETGGGAWSTALFSPVLKFFNGDGEEVEEGAPGATPVTVGYSGAPEPLAVTPPQHQSHHSAAAAAAAAAAASASIMSPTGRAGGSGSGSGSAAAVAASSGTASGAGVGAAVAASAASMAHGRGVPVSTTSSPAASSGSPTVITTATASPAVAPSPTKDPPTPDEVAEEEEYAYEFEEFNPYLFIKLLPAYSTVSPMHPRIVLPRKARGAPRVSLVLDLDETLVHCSVDPIPDADLTFPVEFNGINYMVYVRKRPYLDRFLAAIHGRFEVTVFTASQKVYASRLLDLLDPEKKYIQHRLYRDSCLNVDGNFLKDLNVLGRDLRHTVLVDNSPHAFGYQIGNGIPIESWFEDPCDTELLKLATFLEALIDAPDVRPILKRRFNMQALVDNSTLDGFGPGPRSPGTL